MMNDFEIACDLAEKELSNCEIETILLSDDEIKKPIAVLNIHKIEDEKIVNLLVNHLTNQGGPIREAVSFKISELIKEYPNYFQTQQIYDIFMKSFIDVNPNVVRFMLNTVNYLADKKYFFDNIISKISEIYGEISDKARRGKLEEHIFTKKCFKIYWLLETLKTIIHCEPNLIYENGAIKEDFFDLIKNLAKFEEYTVREKIAQILHLTDDEKFIDLKKILKDDDNYFVKRQII